MYYLMLCFGVVGLFAFVIFIKIAGIMILIRCWDTLKLVHTKDFRRAYSRYRHNKSFWYETYDTIVHHSGGYFSYSADDVQGPHDRLSPSDIKTLIVKIQTSYHAFSLPEFIIKRNELIYVLFGVSIGIAWVMLCVPNWDYELHDKPIPRPQQYHEATSEYDTDE